MSQVTDSWRRIRDWYDRYAPSKLKQLDSGAAIEQVREAESLLALSLPEDVVTSYQIHNGSGGRGVFPYGDELLSLEEMVEQWRVLCSSAADELLKDVETAPRGPLKKVWWSARWVPILFNSGDGHGVDLDPAPGGCVGQFFRFYHEGGPESVLADSFGDWLAHYVIALERGLYRYDPDGDDIRLVDEN